MDLGLANKVILVTGGSSGIGRATAHRLASEGARVAICARGVERLQEAESELRAAGANVLAVPADVSTADGVELFVNEAVKQFASVDGLVNNAGGHSVASFANLTDDMWQADLNLKLFATIRTIRCCLSHLCQTKGSIVNVVNLSGKHPGAGSLPTSTTRAAQLALTKALSKEFAADGVRVNAVCLGVVRSNQHDPLWRREYAHLTRDEFYEQRARKAAIPLGRVGDAEEPADAIAFLLSNRASFITGTSVNVDGGSSYTL